MENKWYIGQPIVAIKNSKYGNIKKGQEFTIKGLQKCSCYCCEAFIDVGLLSDIPIGSILRCDSCNISWIRKDNIMWKHEAIFAPLDQDISELTDILKKPIKEFIDK